MQRRLSKYKGTDENPSPAPEEGCPQPVLCSPAPNEGKAGSLTLANAANPSPVALALEETSGVQRRDPPRVNDEPAQGAPTR